jgi:uncharacterized cupin superfamily protein
VKVIRDVAALTGRRSCGYPAHYAAACKGRVKWALGDPGALTQFGVNLVTLEPGVMSAQRHWHRVEDEFIYVVDGELVLVTDAGEELLSPGMAACFPANDGDGHHLINRSSKPATYLEVGTRSQDEDVVYPDIDLLLERRDGESRFLHKSGEPYP